MRLEPYTVNKVLLLEVLDDREESVGFVVDAFGVEVILRGERYYRIMRRNKDMFCEKFLRCKVWHVGRRHARYGMLFRCTMGLFV